MRTKKTEYKHVLLWPDGTPTLGGTRLKVKHVAAAYNSGQRPEEIQDSYPPHSLAEIYSALAFYFDHKDAIDRQIEEDEREAARLWKEIRERQAPSATRAELEARRDAMRRVG